MNAPAWQRHLSSLDILLVCIPLTAVAEYQHFETAAFFLSCLAIVPLAGLMGKATEFLADRVGEGLGGLLNATFGNACELIIAFAALRAGLQDIVKASITGSIIGNILLVLGGSILAGGLKYQTQTFNRTAATTSATLLALAAISLTVPAIFHISTRALANEDELALGIAIILFITYICSLVFSLKTHKHHYTTGADASGQTESAAATRQADTSDEVGEMETGAWGQRTCMLVLLVSTILVAWLSEVLVHTVEHAAAALHMNRLFIGLILIAIIGNAAEHSTAIMMARKNKMDLSIGIALGSGAQIALFVAPLLVFASHFFGPAPMDLNFSPFEVLAVVVSVIVLSFVATDGECNWLEGVQLLAVYGILGMAFYFAA